MLGIGALFALLPASAATGAPTASTASADVDDFEFESFHADYLLERDESGHAQLSVVETIVAVFPDFDQNRGFYRDIPEYRHGVRLHTEVLSVVDETGADVPYETEYYRDFYSVALGDDSFVRGRQTYLIAYTQVDVVESFADTNADEFYWDVNGTGWAQPFGEVSMTLTIAPDVAAELTGESACYVFAECDVPLTRTDGDDGSAVFTAAASDLVPNESLTVAIGFTAGTFEPGPVVVPPPTDDDGYPIEEPSWWDRFAPFVLGPAAVVVALVARSTRVADRSKRTRASDIIVPQYTPPELNGEPLSVLMAAYIAGRPERAFAAQIVDLAVRKKVRLLDHPADSSAPFEVELLDGTGLSALEQKLVHGVFGSDPKPGRRIPLGSTNRTLGRRLTDLYKSVDKHLKSDGLQGSPRPTALWTVLCVLSVLLVAVAGIDAFRHLAIEGEPTFGIVAVFVAFWAAGSTFTNRSTVATLSWKGRGINDHLLGMRDYMELAEEDRIRMLQSPEGAERVEVDGHGESGVDPEDRAAMVKLYERLLPYAIVFGIEDRWSDELSVAAVAAGVPVTWWAGSSEFSGWRLNSTIQGLRRATPAPPRPVVARAKSTSSGGGWGSGRSSGGWSGSSGSSFSGGSFGGGFSGGGGGGGGGRGR